MHSFDGDCSLVPQFALYNKEKSKYNITIIAQKKKLEVVPFVTEPKLPAPLTLVSSVINCGGMYQGRLESEKGQDVRKIMAIKYTWNAS